MSQTTDLKNNNKRNNGNTDIKIHFIRYNFMNK